ncbi:MAG: stage II sporulation protein P [Christensenellales bacterium]|jgi:stage II sporulation protein P
MNKYTDKYRFFSVNKIGHKRRVFCRKRDDYFFIKAGLCFAITFMLIISFIFASSAGEMDFADKNKIVFTKLNLLIDASGEERNSERNLNSHKLILSQEMPVIYGVDLEEVYLNEKFNSDNSFEQGTDIYFDVLPEKIKLEILDFKNDAPKKFFVSAQGPQIFIYHTHTQEAYRQTLNGEYVETGAWRTNDESYSIVAVGEALKKELEAYGYNVLHNTANHEPPALSTAYSRSLITMENYAVKYPTISVFIDVHRDAYGNVEQGKYDYVTVNGDDCARVMFVVGTGEGKTGDGFNKKPNYESNYKLALEVTNQLEKIKKGFTRPIRVKTGRYNQHVSDMCLLIEVGHNANSLQQAINSTKYISLALSRVLKIK